MGYSFDIDAGEPAAPRCRRPSALRNRHHKMAPVAARLEALEHRLLFNTGLDPLFGNGGRSRIDVADLADYAAAVHRLPDGRILVAGSATWGLDSQLGAVKRAFVARLTANGGLDATFGLAGIATYPPADGRIFVGGSTASGFTPPALFNAAAPTPQPDPQWAVAAFTADGLTDVTFGTGGVATVELFDQPDGMYPMPETVQALAVQPDGKVLAAGALRHIGEHASDVMAVASIPTARVTRPSSPPRSS